MATKKPKLSAKTAKALKELDTIPDKRLKIFAKILVLAKECGIDVRKHTQGAGNSIKRRTP